MTRWVMQEQAQAPSTPPSLFIHQNQLTFLTWMKLNKSLCWQILISVSFFFLIRGTVNESHTSWEFLFFFVFLYFHPCFMCCCLFFGFLYLFPKKKTKKQISFCVVFFLFCAFRFKIQQQTSHWFVAKNKWTFHADHWHPRNDSNASLFFFFFLLFSRGDLFTLLFSPCLASLSGDSNGVK